MQFANVKPQRGQRSEPFISVAEGKPLYISRRMQDVMGCDGTRDFCFAVGDDSSLWVGLTPPDSEIPSANILVHDDKSTTTTSTIPSMKIIQQIDAPVSERTRLYWTGEKRTGPDHVLFEVALENADSDSSFYIDHTSP